MVVVPHPLGGIAERHVLDKVGAAVPPVLLALTVAGDAARRAPRATPTAAGGGA